VLVCSVLPAIRGQRSRQNATRWRRTPTTRGSSESALVKRVAGEHGTGFGIATSPSEIESGTLDALRASIALLEAKAPDEVEAYRSFVLDLARSVAAAAPGGDNAQADAIAKIEAALASGQTAAN